MEQLFLLILTTRTAGLSYKPPFLSCASHLCSRGAPWLSAQSSFPAKTWTAALCSWAVVSPVTQKPALLWEVNEHT